MKIILITLLFLSSMACSKKNNSMGFEYNKILTFPKDFSSDNVIVPEGKTWKLVGVSGKDLKNSGKSPQVTLYFMEGNNYE